MAKQRPSAKRNNSATSGRVTPKKVKSTELAGTDQGSTDAGSGEDIGQLNRATRRAVTQGRPVRQVQRGPAIAGASSQVSESAILVPAPEVRAPANRGPLAKLIGVGVGFGILGLVLSVLLGTIAPFVGVALAAGGIGDGVAVAFGNKAFGRNARWLAIGIGAVGIATAVLEGSWPMAFELLGAAVGIGALLIAANAFRPVAPLTGEHRGALMANGASVYDLEVAGGLTVAAFPGGKLAVVGSIAGRNGALDEARIGQFMKSATRLGGLIEGAEMVPVCVTDVEMTAPVRQGAGWVCSTSTMRKALQSAGLR